MPLKIKVDIRPGEVYIFKLSGSLDSDTYRVLENSTSQALNSITKVIIFDMDGVEYISSMGLSAVFKTQQGIEKLGGTFVMTNLQPQVRKVFDIVNAMPRVKIFENIEEVDAYLYKIQKDEIEKHNNPQE